MDDLLTTKELQDLLKIDRTTVYRMLNDGRLTGVKVGGQWRFPRKEVDAILEGKPAAPPALNPNVLPLPCVQSIQNVFAEVAEIGAVTTAPDGEPLTEVSNACAFCQLILSSESGRQACMASWRELAAKPEHRTQFVSCHAGLQYARARIEVDGNFVAMLVSGQFHAQAPTPDEEAATVSRLAAAHGLEAAALAAAARELPVLSRKNQARIGGWLEAVAHTFEEIGHERSELMRRLKRIAEMSALNSPG